MADYESEKVYGGPLKYENQFETNADLAKDNLVSGASAGAGNAGQVLAIRAVAYALLDIADAIRSTAQKPDTDDDSESGFPF